MFTLLKILVVGAVIVVGLGFALQYVPGSDAAGWGKKAAEYGIKGARGSKALVQSFAKTVKEGTSEKPAPGEE